MEQSYLVSFIGGALIGLSASLLLAINGRVAGISGILGSLLKPTPGDNLWRATFLAGLSLTGLIAYLVAPSAFVVAIERPLSWILIAGLLVGFGTQLGGGCTSGHGVCGLSRLSPRSLIATLTFIAAGAATVFVVEHWRG